jgi:hypothetical protein
MIHHDMHVEAIRDVTFDLVEELAELQCADLGEHKARTCAARTIRAAFLVSNARVTSKTAKRMATRASALAQSTPG